MEACRIIGKNSSPYYFVSAERSTMATTLSHGKNSKAAQHISRLLWQDAILEWGIPTLLIGAIVSFILLGLLGLITLAIGVLGTSGMLLLFCCFLLFKPLLTQSMAAKLKSFTWGLAVAWVIIFCVQLYFSIFVGQEVSSGVLTANNGGIELPLGAQGTTYDLIIEGNFSAAAGEGNREGGYTLLLEKDGQRIQEIAGRLSETTSRQRLGRRGSATAHHLHNHSLHALVSPGEGLYRLTTTHVDPQLTPTLQASLYQDIYPRKIFWLLSAILLIGSYAGEIIYETLEPPLVLVTTAVLAFVVTFRNIGVPPHTYQDIIGAGLVAALAGPLLGWFLRTLMNTLGKSVGIVHLTRGVSPVGKR